MRTKILAGITHDNELYFLEVDTTNDKRNGYNEFSMSGFTCTPILEESVEENANNYLDDEGDYFWRQAVEAKATTLGLDEWIQSVKDEGGMGSFDNSLFDESVDVEGETYLFESGSCGQHQEETLKHYFIDKQLYNVLMEAWDKYHIKNMKGRPLLVNHGAETIEWWLENKLEKQNIEALAMQAITFINNNA